RTLMWQAAQPLRSKEKSASLALSLALYLQPVGADIDLKTFRLLLGLVELEAEHAARDREHADDQIQHIAVDVHPPSPCRGGAANCIDTSAILKATSLSTAATEMCFDRRSTSTTGDSTDDERRDPATNHGRGGSR